MKLNLNYYQHVSLANQKLSKKHGLRTYLMICNVTEEFCCKALSSSKDNVFNPNYSPILIKIVHQQLALLIHGHL